MLKSPKKVLLISMILTLNCFYSISANRRKQKDWFFYGIICIKACIEIEKTQVVCCGHSKNIYFMLNSNKIFHCDILIDHHINSKLNLTSVQTIWFSFQRSSALANYINFILLQVPVLQCILLNCNLAKIFIEGQNFRSVFVF